MVDINKIRIGTRGSRLAIVQAMMVKNKMIKVLDYPEHLIEIIAIKTSGDKFANADLSKIGGKGLFIKEIEEALIDDHIDIAVHSLKDVPAIIPKGLEIGAVLEREDPRDILLTPNGLHLMELKPNAVVGTSSPRRKAQLLYFRPDLEIVLFRGNINTRIKKLNQGDVDATMLAKAGINRVKVENINYQLFDVDVILPAVGQGAIGIEVKTHNKLVCNLLRYINHSESFLEISAERSFLKALEADCTSPVAAYAKIDNNKVILKCLVATEDCRNIYKHTEVLNMENYIDEAHDLGKSLKVKM